MFTETLGFAKSIFPISEPIRQECTSDLDQDEAVPSNWLTHKCGKLQSLKLDGNAAMKIASTRLVGKLVDDPF